MKLATIKPRLKAGAQRLDVLKVGSWRADKASSTARGYGYAWQKARVGYLLSHPWCVRCLAEAGVAAAEPVKALGQCQQLGIAPPPAHVVDHIMPHRGDQALFWDKTNWQSLCFTHHSRDKQREEAAG